MINARSMKSVLFSRTVLKLKRDENSDQKGGCGSFSAGRFGSVRRHRGFFSMSGR
jgi:hypothetical protein